MLISDELIDWLGEIYLKLPNEKRVEKSFERFVEDMIEEYQFKFRNISPPPFLDLSKPA